MVTKKRPNDQKRTISAFFLPKDKAATKTEKKDTAEVIEITSSDKETSSIQAFSPQHLILIKDTSAVHGGNQNSKHERSKVSHDSKQQNGDLATESVCGKSEENVKADMVTHTETKEVNPFAGFAFEEKSCDLNCFKVAEPCAVPTYQTIYANKRDTKKSKKRSKSTGEEDISWDERDDEYKRRCIAKWHSFADSSASLEVQRFQIFVAARLHAQAQVPVVVEAMKSISEHFAETIPPAAFTAETMSNMDALVLASWIPSVHFGTSKAKQIVQASQQLVEQFNGQIPESESELQRLTGIGPSLAAILSRVNARATFGELACIK